MLRCTIQILSEQRLSVTGRRKTLMFLFSNTSLWLELARNIDQTWRDSSEVIIKRSSAMATGTLSADDVHDMISEKQVAMTKSLQNLGLAWMQGGNPLQAAQDALSPFQETTAQNAERLRLQD